MHVNPVGPLCMHGIQQTGIWIAGAYVGPTGLHRTDCQLYTVTNTYSYLSWWWYLSKLRTIFWSFSLLYLYQSLSIFIYLGYECRHWFPTTGPAAYVRTEANPLPGITFLFLIFIFIHFLFHLSETSNNRLINIIAKKSGHTKTNLLHDISKSPKIQMKN